MMEFEFVEHWRREKTGAYNLKTNSTAKQISEIKLWGRPWSIYSNANLSIYSAQPCNAACRFCVEELRPASRGVALEAQKVIEKDDVRYFKALESVLNELKPLNVSVSITGGEPSKDKRLPAILETISRHNMRKRTMTTNGSGLLDLVDGKTQLDWILKYGLSHLNISRAHPDTEKNGEIMRMKRGLNVEELSEVVRKTAEQGCRIRLSCVLLKDVTSSMENIVTYLEFARSVGVDNVVFRQLMKSQYSELLLSQVVKYSDENRVLLEPLLDEVSLSGDFTFQKQVVGYYYYVEVWKYKDIDVVFEEADLNFIEEEKKINSDLVYELIFHPNGRLCSTWQPWDGDLGPY